MEKIPEIKKRAARIVEIDGTVTKVVVKKDVQAIKLEDEGSSQAYRILRSPKKGGLQMIGD